MRYPGALRIAGAVLLTASAGLLPAAPAAAQARAPLLAADQEVCSTMASARRARTIFRLRRLPIEACQ